MSVYIQLAWRVPGTLKKLSACSDDDDDDNENDVNDDDDDQGLVI